MNDGDPNTLELSDGLTLGLWSTPRARDDLIVREYDNEAVAWSPIRSQPAHLKPLPAVLLRLLDGEVSVGELVGDLTEVLEVGEDVARLVLRRDLSSLHDAGMLTTSPALAGLEGEPEVFASSWNP